MSRENRIVYNLLDDIQKQEVHVRFMQRIADRMLRKTEKLYDLLVYKLKKIPSIAATTN